MEPITECPLGELIVPSYIFKFCALIPRLALLVIFGYISIFPSFFPIVTFVDLITNPLPTFLISEFPSIVTFEQSFITPSLTTPPVPVILELFIIKLLTLTIELLYESGVNTKVELFILMLPDESCPI